MEKNIFQLKGSSLSSRMSDIMESSVFETSNEIMFTILLTEKLIYSFYATYYNDTIIKLLAKDKVKELMGETEKLVNLETIDCEKIRHLLETNILKRPGLYGENYKLPRLIKRYLNFELDLGCGYLTCKDLKEQDLTDLILFLEFLKIETML